MGKSGKNIKSIITILIVSVWFSTTLAQSNPELSKKPIKCVSGYGKAVALTFDDGLRPEIHKQLLNLAKKESVLVTFFLIGNTVDKNRLLKRTIREGHEIGNHSMTHSVLTKLSDEELRSEILDFQMMFKEDYDYVPTVFRAPKLQYDERVMKVLKESNLIPVNATVGTKDWAEDTTKEYIYNKAISAMKTCDGCIILMHEVKKTVDVLPQIIKYYRDNGYKFVTVSQLLSNKIQ